MEYTVKCYKYECVVSFVVTYKLNLLLHMHAHVELELT